MPSSHHLQLNEIVGIILGLRPQSVLDIGPGFGKYGVLAREYLEFWDGRYKYDDWKCRIDCVEVFKPYITPLHGFIYDNVYICDAATHLSSPGYHYDMILLIDVLEHFTKESGQRIVDLCRGRCDTLLVSTPRKCLLRGATFGNPNEAHISAWVEEDFSDWPHKFIANPRSLIYVIEGDREHVIV